jgi:uncharacterized repeat protein (TIGR03803 family)
LNTKNAGSLDKAGNLYGTAHLVFELSHGADGWTEKVLHRFTGGRDGTGAASGLISNASGGLYGATDEGGTHKAGTVFEVSHTSSGWKEQVLHDFPALPLDGQVPAGEPLAIDASGNLYGTTGQGGANICYDVGCGTIFRLS